MSKHENCSWSNCEKKSLEQRNVELAAQVEDLTKWRDLALRFDAARMSANSLLKCLLSCHDNDVFTADAWNKTFEDVRKLLKDSPPSILLEHNREVAAMAGKAGFIAGVCALQESESNYEDFYVEARANGYANKIKSGEVKL